MVFHECFTWIVLGSVDLCFSFILVTKISAVEGGIYISCVIVSPT